MTSPGTTPASSTRTRVVVVGGGPAGLMLSHLLHVAGIDSVVLERRTIHEIETTATVHLAVRDGQEVLYVDRLAGHASVPVVSTIGSRLPLHATGVGKVLLAHAPAAVREQVLGRLDRITPYTVVQPGRLQRQLERVLADGVATTREEMSLGACSLAVPVEAPGAGGEVVAALGIVVPSLERSQARLVPALQVAARGITRALRAPGEP